MNLLKYKKRLFMGAFFIALGLLMIFNQNDLESASPEYFYKNKVSGQMTEFKAIVSHVLTDDDYGSRHQRVILKRDQMTLLLTHNIDLSKRVPVDTGDELTVYGQYEWNEKGGVIHWTHDDPNKQHTPGWIKHKGIVYGKLIN